MTTAKTVGAVSSEAAEWYAINWQTIHQNVRRLQVRIVQATKAGRWNKVKFLQRLLTHSYRSEAAEWYAINWQTIHQNVRRLQVRIVQATKAGRWNKVKSLQRLLTHSYSGKVLAVRRVTENNGRKTPGVDQIIWKTPKDKTQAVYALKSRGYQSQPLRRVYIPKSDGKTMRPLGIPTMKDRAQQALYLLALGPVVETTADKNSYGFRQQRSCADAIEQCFKALRSANPQWILEADIKSCFDKISHDWLLAHVPMDRVILQKWLKSGYMEKHVLHETADGTPQGGIISLRSLTARWTAWN